MTVCDNFSTTTLSRVIQHTSQKIPFSHKLLSHKTEVIIQTLTREQRWVMAQTRDTHHGLRMRYDSSKTTNLDCASTTSLVPLWFCRWSRSSLSLGVRRLPTFFSPFGNFNHPCTFFHPLFFFALQFPPLCLPVPFFHALLVYSFAL